MGDDTNYIIGLSFFEGIGPLRYRLLTGFFGSARAVFEASKEDLLRVGLPPKLIGEFCQFRLSTDLQALRKSIGQKGIVVITEKDSLYPSQLSEAAGAPFILYALGNPKLLSERSMIAIVGTRKPTPYGRDITRSIATDLSDAGVCIVSGMAMGVDAVAHEAALSHQGKTIAVLGCGVDICYPRINYELYKRIIQEGLIISEFPPGMQTSKGVFPSRNRIVAGLSAGVVVTEGAEKSGSLITARFAGEYGRDVYAVPGPVTSPLSYASNFLLKNGAKIATCAADILEDFNMRPVPKKVLTAHLSPEEQRIVDLLKGHDTMHIDEIGRALVIASSQLSIAMSALTLKGILRERQNGEYTILV